MLDPSSSAVLFVPAVVEYVIVLAASARSRVDRPSPRSVVRGGEAVPGPGRSSRPSGRRRSRNGYALVDTTMVKRSLHPAEIQITYQSQGGQLKCLTIKQEAMESFTLLDIDS